MARGLQISDSEWDVMEPIWAAGACTAADVIKAASRDARLESQHDPHAPGAARREGGAGLRRRRVAVHLPGRRLPPAVRAPGRPLVPGEGVRRRRRGAGRALRRGSVARSGPDRATPSIARPQEESPGRNEHDHAARYPRTGDLAGLLAGGGTGGPGRAALAVLRGTPVAAVALSAVGRRPDAAAVRGDSRQPLERVQSRPLESGGGARPIAHREADATLTPAPHRPDSTAGPDETARESPRRCRLRAGIASRAGECARRRCRRISSGAAMESTPSVSGLFDALSRHAGPVVDLAGRLSVAGVEAPGDRARPASAPFGLPPRDGCGRAGPPGRLAAAGSDSSALPHCS